MARQATILSFDEARSTVDTRRRATRPAAPRSSTRPRSARSQETSTASPEHFQQPLRFASDAYARPERVARVPREESAVRNNESTAAVTASPEQPSRFAERRRERSKAKADRAFDRQFGGSAAAAPSEGAPRAALYKGEMGSTQRRASRMNRSDDASASLKRKNGFSIASLSSSPKFVASLAVIGCLVLTCLFLYPSAQQYYQASRERDRLAAEYTVIEQRNEALADSVSALQTDAGVEDRAREQLGWVKEGEQSANVYGIDVVDEESQFRANVVPGSVEAPATWYSPILDPLFGVK